MFRRLAVLSLVLISLAGCRSTQQTVVILSTPPGASVEIDGKAVGQTPLQLNLKTKHSHGVTVHKKGYKTGEALLVAQDKPDAPYVKFGLKVDAGHYRELVPAPLHVELISEIVPDSIGSDRFDELGQRIAELDTLLTRGEIIAAEHARIMEQILALYQP